jgi:hypothetical protein
VCRAFALDPAVAVTQYGLRTWTGRNGLPGEAVYDVMQTFFDRALFTKAGNQMTPVKYRQPEESPCAS